jgi:hypothetical protein
MYDVNTPEEYMRLLEQTIYEVDDLMRCAEDEGDVDPELTSQLASLQAIRQSLVLLAAQLASGDHEFGKGKELPFMGEVRNARYLPFRPMFDALNSAYRKGFESEEN